MASPVSAQRDKKAFIAGIDTIVNKFYDNYQKELNAFVENEFKKFRKDPELATGIARAYYPATLIMTSREENPNFTDVSAGRKDLALYYLDKATKNNSKYAPAYVMYAQIKECEYKPDSAKYYYNKAIECDTSNIETYKAYAKFYENQSKYNEACLDSALNILQQIKMIDPIYPIDIDIAHLYNKKGSVGKANEIFRQQDMTSLSLQDLHAYATNLFFEKEYADGERVALYGVEKFPAEHSFYEMVLFNASAAGHFKIAAEYGEKYFEMTPDSALNMNDYQLYGLALEQVKEYDKAIELYTRILELKPTRKILEDAEKLHTTLAASQAVAKSQIMDIYINRQMFEEAFAWSDAFIEKKSVDGKPREVDLYDFAKYYERVKVADQHKKLVVKKEMDSWERLDKEYPENQNYIYGLYKCLQGQGVLDSEYVQSGSAVKYAEMVCSRMAIEQNPDPSNEQIYIICLRYLTFHYFKNDNKAGVQKYIRLWYDHELDSNQMSTAMKIAEAMKIKL